MSLVLTIFVIVLVMNAINFIDGLDGLVAGVALIANSVFFVYCYVISYGPTEQTGYFNLAQFIAAVAHRRVRRLPAAQLASRAALHGRRRRARWSGC